MSFIATDPLARMLSGTNGRAEVVAAIESNHGACAVGIFFVKGWIVDDVSVQWERVDYVDPQHLEAFKVTREEDAAGLSPDARRLAKCHLQSLSHLRVKPNRHGVRV